ncbi:MAG: glutathione peroxidase [Verrucomicrobiota bacterium]
MLLRIIIPAFVMAASAFAADLTNISFKDASGKQTSLKDYQGKVVLLVNLASKCGLTPQYEGLEALYKKHKDEGFVVLGFPCNDFGNQEPGTIEEIQKFCKTEYDVTFPVMDKISVKGEKQHKLYEALTGKDGAFPGDVRWNFGKFLIGKDGKAIARFEPTTKPDSAELTGAVEKAIAGPANK